MTTKKRTKSSRSKLSDGTHQITGQTTLPDGKTGDYTVTWTDEAMESVNWQGFFTELLRLNELRLEREAARKQAKVDEGHTQAEKATAPE